MILLVMVFFKEAVGLCFLLSLTEMNAFLFGVVWFVGFAAFTFDMRGPLLAFLSTVLALCDRPALLWD
jgi:hypothetical protein